MHPLETKEAFLREFARNGGNALAASRVVGVGRETAKNWGRQAKSAGSGVRKTVSQIVAGPKPSLVIPQDRRRLTSDIQNGSVVVFSDAHYWPGEITTAHRAVVDVCKRLRPVMTIANGDVFDGARIGRHPRIGWEKQPTVKEELDACRDRLDEIVAASPGAARVWNWGNHDTRFDSYVSGHAGELEGLAGVSLSDYFPAWQFGWSLWINEQVVVKHRFNGGIHTGYNNAVKSGKTILTGHTHALECKPIGDYNGRRWGVQTGTLADTAGPQFVYAEDAPSHQCSGFVVLTFRDGTLAPPELCEVINGRAWFRGEVVAE